MVRLRVRNLSKIQISIYHSRKCVLITMVNGRHSTNQNTIQENTQQRKLLFIALYLLIWGEAANIRFMPECLCYIFHNVSS